VAALRLIINEWELVDDHHEPGAIPRHLTDLRDKIRVFVCPTGAPNESFHERSSSR